MKDITIFSPTDGKKTLTRAERLIVFSGLELATQLPSYHFEAFNDLEEHTIATARPPPATPSPSNSPSPSSPPPPT